MSETYCPDCGCRHRDPLVGDGCADHRESRRNRRLEAAQEFNASRAKWDAYGQQQRVLRNEYARGYQAGVKWAQREALPAPPTPPPEVTADPAEPTPDLPEVGAWFRFVTEQCVLVPDAPERGFAWGGECSVWRAPRGSRAQILRAHPNGDVTVRFEVCLENRKQWTNGTILARELGSIEEAYA